MKSFSLSREDVVFAKEHGIAVLFPSEAAFAAKCRSMGLDPEKAASPHAVMLEYRVRDWFIFVVAFLFGCAVVYFMSFAQSPLLLLCLAAMCWLCWYSASRRHRLIFADGVLTVAHFAGLYWQVDAVGADEEAELHREWVDRQGYALKLDVRRIPWGKMVLLLPPGQPDVALVWTAVLFARWKGEGPDEARRPSAPPHEVRAGSSGRIHARPDLKDSV